MAVGEPASAALVGDRLDEGAWVEPPEVVPGGTVVGGRSSAGLLQPARATPEIPVNPAARTVRRVNAGVRSRGAGSGRGSTVPQATSVA
ncbi:hypothetical protein EAH86_07165 [Pedococcus bigeumensis]|uniref:Uncharacterized protein n=1 Tax=Pedococcus bigeumensis TaxID=433644 RepID=A0A502CX52_9MICO|nr:hypothetical protein EAH86_07165 [Pedococcus bigeumensis]